jgi:hypothetical protein
LTLVLGVQNGTCHSNIADSVFPNLFSKSLPIKSVKERGGKERGRGRERKRLLKKPFGKSHFVGKINCSFFFPSSFLGEENKYSAVDPQTCIINRVSYRPLNLCLV